MASEYSILLNEEVSPLQSYDTSKREKLANFVQRSIRSLTAVFLCMLVNLLDAISYGSILFPTYDARFKDYSIDAISMFLMGTIISQFIFSWLSSFKKGVTSSVMVEVIPYIHIISLSIANTAPSEKVMPTVVMSTAIATFMAGLCFYLITVFKIDALVYQLPRFLLIGSIGGIGMFLLSTTIELVSDLHLSMSNSSLFAFFSLKYMKYWIGPLVLGCFLFYLTRRIRSTMLIPIFCVSIVGSFYFIALVVFQCSLDQLRNDNWIFKTPKSTMGTALNFYRFYRPDQVDWYSIWTIMPSLIGMIVFCLIHVPINVPSFSLLTHQHVDLKRELKVHGLTNIITSLTCAMPNYFVYSTSVLFHRAGADSWIDGILLAVGTIVILFFGFGILNYIPKILIGSLIIYISVDLFYVSLVESYKMARKVEYFGICLITFSIAIFGFTEGLIAGIVFAAIIVVWDVSKFTKPNPKAKTKIINSIPENIFLDLCHKNLVQYVKFDRYLFFGNTGKIVDQIISDLHEDLLFLIVDYSDVLATDMTALEALRNLPKSFIYSDTRLISIGLSRNVLEPMKLYDYPHGLDFSLLEDAYRFISNFLLNEYETIVSSKIQNVISDAKMVSANYEKYRFRNGIPLFDQLYGFISQELSSHHNECLWEANDCSDFVLFILDGCVKLSSSEETFYYYSNTVVGGSEFVTQEPRKLSAISVGQVRYVTLSFPEFSKLSQQNHILYLELMKSFFFIENVSKS